MIRRIEFLGLLALAWLLIFQLDRLLFFLYQFFEKSHQPFRYFFESALHGFRMDLSFAAYLIFIPSLLMAFTSHAWRWYRYFMLGFAGLLAFLIALILTSDLEVYRSWGFRIDSTPLRYLNNPSEALASMSSSPLLVLCIVFIASVLLIYQINKKLIAAFLTEMEVTGGLSTFLVFLGLTSLLIIPIRGGLQLAPMNQSAVYYSTNNFANQLAVNAPWNFFSSLVNQTGRTDNPFVVMKDQDAETLVKELHPIQAKNEAQLAFQNKPNVLIIIWESFTAKVVSSLGGVPQVTPQFDALTQEGLYFRNIYASGDRSDKGLVSLLSGYPAQPTTSIITIPTKTATLPSLPKSFRKNGYSTSFYYGGESEFANIKSYLLQQGFDRIVDKNAFQEKDMNSKWGAHDHIVFQRLLDDLDSLKSPFFTTLFTLSSHEPFEVPVPTVIPGDDVEHKFLNAHHYTDASLGEFIRKAKTKPWWNNTLVVIIADHGHPLPATGKGKPEDFHIPMLWLGGVVKTPGTVCDTLGSQIDLAGTLLEQLHLPAEEFIWSNPIFTNSRTPYAFFSFNNGFGWKKPGGYLVYDNVGKRNMEKQGVILPLEKRRAMAYQQWLFRDFLSR